MVIDHDRLLTQFGVESIIIDGVLFCQESLASLLLSAPAITSYYLTNLQ